MQNDDFKGQIEETNDDEKEVIEGDTKIISAESEVNEGKLEKDESKDSVDNKQDGLSFLNMDSEDIGERILTLIHCMMMQRIQIKKPMNSKKI